MKKMITLITVFTLLFCLAACGGNRTQANNPSSSGKTQKQEQPDGSQNSPSSSKDDSHPAGTGGKALVVYFSHSGNTESVAKEIQAQTGADIFEIVPTTPYTTNYNALLDVAQNEKRVNARPAISGSVENLDDYDTIYLGFPNWWADMPMVLYTFLDTYDLSGKTIAPFVTSGGSGFSNTISTIRSMEPNATITEGLAIRDSAAGNPASAVSEWLEKLK